MLTGTLIMLIETSFKKLHNHREKAESIPSVTETLTLAKLSNLRISQTNEVPVALHSEISTKNNDFQGSG